MRFDPTVIEAAADEVADATALVVDDADVDILGALRRKGTVERCSTLKINKGAHPNQCLRRLQLSTAVQPPCAAPGTSCTERVKYVD